MRLTQPRFVSIVCSSLAALSLALMVGCGGPPDNLGGVSEDGDKLYGAEITATPDPDSESAGDVGDDTPDGPIVAVDDSEANTASINQGLVANGKMKTTANLNLRKGAGTGYAVLMVIPSGSTVTLLSTTASNGFLNISFSGSSGWASASYLSEVATTGGDSGGTSGTVDLNGSPSPDNAFARAKKAVGFSYYWGGGAWTSAGVTSSTAGSCSGSCPSCTHSGKYGADCSGLVAKAWQFGSKALETNSHPYSTVSFNGSSSNWKTVSRSSLKKGDALVYNSNGAGHIVLFEKGDGWGTPTVVECRGCSYGCVYNARSFTSNYKGIRRTGF